jgi:hypothetical protein
VLLTIILVFSALGVGFASGYGVREWISRSRRSAAREALEIRHRLLARR